MKISEKATAFFVAALGFLFRPQQVKRTPIVFPGLSRGPCAADFRRTLLSSFIVVSRSPQGRSMQGAGRQVAIRTQSADPIPYGGIFRLSKALCRSRKGAATPRLRPAETISIRRLSNCGRQLCVHAAIAPGPSNKDSPSWRSL